MGSFADQDLNFGESTVWAKGMISQSKIEIKFSSCEGLWQCGALFLTLT